MPAMEPCAKQRAGRKRRRRGRDGDDSGGSAVAGCSAPVAPRVVLEGWDDDDDVLPPPMCPGDEGVVHIELPGWTSSPEPSDHGDADAAEDAELAAAPMLSGVEMEPAPPAAADLAGDARAGDLVEYAPAPITRH